MRDLAQVARLRARGFSFAECAVVALIFAVLVGTILQRMGAYQEQAEQVAIRNMETALRAALALRTGHLRAIGKDAEIAGLAGQNPIQWLTKPPPNYIGEYFNPVPPGLTAGNWYFNSTSKHLTYLLHTRGIFPPGTIVSVQYAVELIHLPADNERRTASAVNNSVALVQIER
jgi:type II secretory pathway pseudopilin PulG